MNLKSNRVKLLGGKFFIAFFGASGGTMAMWRTIAVSRAIM